jgi:hypothetical protein
MLAPSNRCAALSLAKARYRSASLYRDKKKYSGSKNSAISRKLLYSPSSAIRGIGDCHPRPNYPNQREIRSITGIFPRASLSHLRTIALLRAVSVFSPYSIQSDSLYILHFRFFCDLA